MRREDSNNYPLDGGKQPLQLRRGSDREARRSLIEKYQGDLNKSSEENDVGYNVGKKPTKINHDSNETYDQLATDIQSNKRRNLFIGLGVGAVIVLVITLILVFTLKKKDEPIPDPPGPDPHPDDSDLAFNPYLIRDLTEPTDYSSRQYKLFRDTSIPLDKFTESFKRYSVETKHNKFVDSVILKTSVLGTFNTVRMTFHDEKNPDSYKVSDEFLSAAYAEEKSKNTRAFSQMEETKFAVDISSDRRPVNSSAFVLRAFRSFILSESNENKQEDFLTTKDQEFVMMTHFQQVCFEAKSQRFMGWGDQRETELFLKNSTEYVIFPHTNGQIQSSLVSPAAHPFLMMQITGTKQFAGIFLRNAAPMSLEAKFYPETSAKKGCSKLTFRATGGSMDFFVFYGPSFDQVIRQYQDLIGRPKMLPLWAHGFFSKSEAYKDSKLALEAIEGYKQSKYPLSGLVLPVDYNEAYFTGSSSVVKDIREKYPKAKEMQLIYPLSYLVPDVKTSTPAWIDDFKKSNSGKTFAVRAEDEPLYLEVDDGVKGWCMDVFNPRFVNDFLEPKLLRNLQDIYSAVWLERNSPFIKNSTHVFKDSWDDLPFRPHGAFLRNATLPEQAQHDLTGNGNYEYHSNVHGVFGATFAKQVITNMPTFRTQLHRPFVISDSTYAGLGQYGAAHFLPDSPEGASYIDLKRSLVSLINYGMFGIPNVGPKMCDFGYKKDGTWDFDDLICGKYFQMAIFSPLALYSDRINDLTHHPYHLNNTEDIFWYVTSLFLRNSMIIYQRSQLALLERWGGSLLRPMFAEFPDSYGDYSSAQLLMWGSDVMIEINLDNTTLYRNFTFPKENDWVSLTTFSTFKGGETIEIKYDNSFGLGIYQKSGTIVAQQDPSQVNNVADLRNATLKLSIALNQGYAYGNIFIEDGSEDTYRSELHEIWVENNAIGFKQQNSLSPNDYANDTIIEAIRISFVDRPVNSACALLKDMRTVRTLSVGPYDSTDKQAFIQTHNPENPDTSLKINEIAYIYYGENEKNESCSDMIFKYTLTETIVQDDSVYEAKLTSGLSTIMPQYAAPQYLRIELLSDNSVSVQLSDRRLAYDTKDRETPTQILDRNFTYVKSQEKKVKLSQVLQVPQNVGDLFCYNLTSPSNSTLVYLSTCGSMLESQHASHSIFNFEQRSSAKGKFFGLGERKGTFFLKDDTTYSLYNNNNNAGSSQGAFGDNYEFGRNGFHPYIFSSLLNSTNMTGILFFTGHGLEITFDEEKDKEGAQFSVHSSSKDLEFVFVFDLDPLHTVRKIQHHIKLGSLLQKVRPDFSLPPPLWAFGHHATIPRDPNTRVPVFPGIKDLLTGIPASMPLDGLVLSSADLDHEYSFSLDPKFFDEFELDLYNQQGFILTQISSSDRPLHKPWSQGLGESKSHYIQTQDDKDYISYDDNGKVGLIDFSQVSSSAIVANEYEAFVQKARTQTSMVGVSLKRNEISIQECAIESCFIDYQQLPTSTWFIHKPGNLDQTIGTLFNVKRELGLEENLHNLNGLMEQIAFANTDLSMQYQLSIPLLISDATSLGSGHLNNVARLPDYYDISSDADLDFLTQQMQLLSIMGLPMVATHFKGTAASQLKGDHSVVVRGILFNTFSTAIGVNEFYGYAERELTAKELSEFSRILNIKYLLSAYTRTQVFKHINFGSPVIYPIFFQYPTAEQNFGNQYMFGPNIVATTDVVYSLKPQYLPKDTQFCSAQSLSSTSFCFSDGQIPSTSNGKVEVILAPGGITPIFQQNLTDPNFSVSRGLVMELDLDLHVFPANNKSQGEIILDSGRGTQGNTNYCFLSMSMENETITVQDITQPHGGKPTQGCGAFSGQTFSTLYLYGYKQLTPQSNGYQSAKVNGDSYLLDLIELDSSELVGVFKLIANSTFSGKLSLSDIKTIVFSLDQPPAPPAA